MDVGKVALVFYGYVRVYVFICQPLRLQRLIKGLTSTSQHLSSWQSVCLYDSLHVDAAAESEGGCVNTGYIVFVLM
jgi:hypothetical protein